MFPAQQRWSTLVRKIGIVSVLVGVFSAGQAGAVSQYEMKAVAERLADAQRSAPYHIQLRIDRVETRGDDTVVPCMIEGRVATIFRGSLAVGEPLRLVDSCIMHVGRLPTGGIIRGFRLDRLKGARFLEVYLESQDDRLVIAAGWIISEPSRAPLHPAP